MSFDLPVEWQVTICVVGPAIFVATGHLFLGVWYALADRRNRTNGERRSISP